VDGLPGLRSLPRTEAQEIGGLMNIQHVTPEELLVKIDSNPSSADIAPWMERIKSSLTGEEKLARVDLTSLEVISSLGVNIIVGLYKNLEKQGGGIRVLVPGEKMANVFELFRLTELLRVEIVRS
jgi:anti-anti-sigma factor